MSRLRVNEIFLSLQGEGFWMGTPSVFIRLSGCNLRCPFCDTDHEAGTPMTEDEIARRAAALPARHVVLTGGEPSLFATARLVRLLHERGKFVAIETNGTRTLPEGIDWVTLSPKEHAVGTAARPAITECDELKVVCGEGDFPQYPEISARHRFVQPCDTGDDARTRQNVEACIAFCLSHPGWRLSLQTHKLLGIR